MRASSATSRPAASSLGRAAGAERSSGASALVSLPQRPCRAAQPPRVVCGSRGPAPGDAPVTARQNSPARLAPSAVNNIIPAPAQLHCEVQQQPTEACQPSSALAAPAADFPSTEPLLLQPGSVGPRAPLTSRPAAAANGSLEGMHRPVGLVVGSAWLLATSVQLAGGLWVGFWRGPRIENFQPVAAGSFIRCDPRLSGLYCLLACRRGGPDAPVAASSGWRPARLPGLCRGGGWGEAAVAGAQSAAQGRHHGRQLRHRQGLGAGVSEARGRAVAQGQGRLKSGQRAGCSWSQW